MEDPIIHFYETFLSEYDPKLRKARGVWYTPAPAPVVNFIVRAVDDILTIEEGFEVDIIKDNHEKCEDHCRKLNKHFINKRFSPEQINNHWRSTCKNYFDKINVTIDGRVDLDIVMDEARLKNIFDKFSKNNFEFAIHGFKIYWNWHKSSISLYLNNKVYVNEFKSDDEKYTTIKKGIDELILLLRNYL